MISWHPRICSITLAARDSSPWREKKSRRRPDQISKSWAINYLNFTFILISSAASKRRGLECTVGVGFCKSGQNFWNTNNFVQKIPLFSHYPVRDVTSVFTIFAINSDSLCDDALIPVARNRTVMNNVFSDRFPFRRLRSVPSGGTFLAPTHSARLLMRENTFLGTYQIGSWDGFQLELKLTVLDWVGWSSCLSILNVNWI